MAEMKSGRSRRCRPRPPLAGGNSQGRLRSKHLGNDVVILSAARDNVLKLLVHGLVPALFLTGRSKDRVAHDLLLCDAGQWVDWTADVGEKKMTADPLG